MKKFVSGLILGLAATGAAQAALITASQIYTTGAANQYIGTYNPNNSDFATGLTHAFPGSNEPAFTDNWVFTLSPAGLWSGSANFNPTGGISGFIAQLYSVSGLTCGAIGALCTGSGSYSLLLSGNLLNSASAIDFSALGAGTYALRVSGDPTTISSYTGQINTRPSPIPEPGSLALLGLGLLAVGVSRRR